MQKENKNQLKIRQATPKDWNKILPLLKQLYHNDIGPNMKNTFNELTKNKQNLILIAEQNQTITGALIANYYLDLDWEAKTAKLQAIIVHKKHRNKSIGTKLFQQFHKHAKQHKCKAITLRVNRKNKTAALFYEKLNFTKAETNEYTLELP